MNPTSPSLGALRALILVSLGAGCIFEGKTSDECKGSTAILDDAGEPTGFERCEDGTVHRVSVVATSADIDEPACEGTEAYRSCDTDADCTSGPNGRCIHDDYVELGGRLAVADTGVTGDDGCGCAYSCATDADCGEGYACIPDGVMDKDGSWATCEPATCTTDADCSGGECGLSSFHDGCSYDTYLTCRTVDDECRVEEDCGGEPCAVGWGSEGYACQSVTCAIGRPLLVAGEARTAAPRAGGAWSAAVDLSSPGGALGAALGAHWAAVAALEHASVASFARFTLQLLALGAPPDLVADAQRAAADEVEHARLAYGLASALGGAAVEPGPLPLDGVGVSADRCEVLRSLIAEACIGETLGAAEATASAEGADPAMREALGRIAADEARHAALAWRTLRWLVGEDAELAAFARGVFAAERSRDLVGAEGLHAPRYGALGGAARRALHADVWRAVIGPCADAALGSDLA